MATDSTNLPNELNTDAGSDMAGNELEFGAVQVAQVTADGGQPVQLPQGQRVVLIPVQPGQTLTLPTDTQNGLLAKIGPEGNLSIVVDGRTIIFQGYVDANNQTPVRIVTTGGEEIDVADVVAATDPTLNIQTAAGPATGDQGDDAGNGIFVPFQVGPGPGLIGAEGVLGATALQYRLIDDEREEFVQDEDTGPSDIQITFDLLGGIINEDDLRAQTIIDERDQLAAKLVIQANGNDEEGNDPFDTKDRENQNGTPDDTDDVDDNGAGVDADREPLFTVATVKVTFGDDTPGTLKVDTTNLPTDLTSEGEPIVYEILPPSGTEGNGIVAFVDFNSDGKFNEADGDRKVFDIKVQEASSDSEFHVLFTLYDNIDNEVPDQNGDGTYDLLGGDEQIQNLPVKLTATDSDGSSLSTVMKLGVEDDIPFFGDAVEIGGEGGFSVTITPGDSSITHDESWFVQSDDGADDQSLFDPQASSAAFEATKEVTDAGFGLPYGDSVGSLIGIAQTQVLASFGADGRSRESDKKAGDEEARNSIFGELSDRADGLDDGLVDGVDAAENELPFELFMIEAGKGSTPLEDKLGTAENEGNLTIADQLTNATVTWDGGEILNVYLRQIDATTIVGYVIPEGEQPSLEARGLNSFDSENGEEAVFVISIDQDGVMTFVQYHQINHEVDGPTSDDHDDSFEILAADGVTPLVHVRITDYDGDHATQPVVVAIQDDGPCFIKTFWDFDGDSTNPFNGTGLIDEDALPNGKSGGPGDELGGKHADGTVFFDFGVDQPGTIDIQGLKITNSLGLPVAEIDADGIFVSGALRTADGRDVEVTRSVDAGTGIITWQGVVAVGEAGAGTPVFTLTLDGEGGNLGDFDFDLHLPLEHQFHDKDSQNNGPETAYEDNLNFEFTVRGEDVDGDWADGSIKIRIDDDSPVAVNDKDSVVEGKGNTATGNVVTAADLALIGTDANGTDGSKDAPGADQPYTISKLAHGTDTYNLIDNGDGTFSVTKNGGNPLGAGESFVGGKLTIPTDEGGTFEIIMVSTTQSEVGEYRYTAGDPPHHDSDVLGGPADTAASRSAAFDTLGEWTTSFTTAGITLTPINGALAIKDINVSGPNDYRGIGVSSGGEVEVDNVGPDEQLKVGLPGLTNNAKLQIGALFDGNQFDNGNQEILLWQVLNGSVLVASGQILGSDNGLVSLDIDTGGQQFNSIILTPINNGAGDNGNNSDFLLLNVEICSQKDVNETFDYTLRDADGDESTATLTIKVEDTQPTIPGQTSGGLQIIVDEDGLNPSGTIKDGIGDAQPGDLEEAHGGANAAQDDAKHIGTIPFVAGADPVTVELTVDNDGDTGLLTLTGQKIFAAWDAEENRLVGYVQGTDPSDAPNQIFIMQITGQSPGNINYTFTLLQPIKHPNDDGNEQGDNTENNPDPFVNIQVQIEDKDCDVAYTTLKVVIDDDMPVVCITADDHGTTQHDETAGRQTDSGDDDQNGSVPALFNVLSAGPAIGWAHDGDSVVHIDTARYGADGPGFATYSLGIPAGNVDSGVDTTDGKSVWLFQGPNGIIVGRAGSGAGGSTPDANGQIIFAISIDNDGELTVVQYDSLNHPDDPNNYDEDIGLNTEALQVRLTLTDADDDSASDTANIGNLVRFDDDGPKARIEATGHSVQHDETAGVQNPGSGADRDQAGALPAAFSGIVGTLIGWARSDSSVISTAGSSTGSDDEGATTTLKVQVAFAGVDSGIDDTDTGQNILLYQNGDRVEGRVGGIGGAVAFAVTINGNGTLDVAQYRALEHPNTNDHDDDVWITNSALKAVYTVIDGDGDLDDASVDIGNAVHFDDDGPTANLTQASGAQIVLDESVGAPGAGEPADPNANDEVGNVVGDIGYAKVSGASLFTDTSVFGQDGPADSNSKVFSLTLPGGNGSLSGLQDAQTNSNVTLHLTGGAIEGRVGADVVFRITVNSGTGEVTISQFRAVEHNDPNDPDESTSPEIMDLNKILLNLTVKDGDGDTSTDNIDLGKLIKFEDDGVIARDDVDTLTHLGGGQYGASGDVVTGDDVTVPGVDDGGSDKVAFVSKVTNYLAASITPDSNGENIAGKYGTLRMESDGDYTYDFNEATWLGKVPSGATEVFTYTYKDSDGDTDTATLTINMGSATVETSAVVNPETGACVPEDTYAPLALTATPGTGDKVTQIVLSNVPAGWDVKDTSNADFQIVGGTISGSPTFAGGVITFNIINAVAGVPVTVTVQIKGAPDSDVNGTGLVVGATVVDGVVFANDTTPFNVVVDAVADGDNVGDDGDADALGVTILVTDSNGDANDSFQLNEIGNVKVTASFDDFKDGSETHTLSIQAPTGFTFGALGVLPAGVVLDVPASDADTLVFKVDSKDGDGVNGVGDFELNIPVTYGGGAEGSESGNFSAVVTATETPTDSECNPNNNTDSATATDTVPLATPPVALGATAFVDEDGLVVPPGAVVYNPNFGDDNADLPPDTVPGEAIFGAASLPVDWNGALNGTTTITLAAGDWSALRTIDGNAIAVVGGGTALLQGYDITDTTAGVPNPGATPVFEIQILDQFTGQYQVRLLQPMLHPDSNNNPADDVVPGDDGKGTFEDNLTIPVVVSYVSPGGGDDADLVITVDDDSPYIVTAGTKLAPGEGDIRLDDESSPLPGYVGIPGSEDGTDVAGAPKSTIVYAVANGGADGLNAIVLDFAAFAAANSTLRATDGTSDGAAIAYTLEGGDVVARISEGGMTGVEVFRVHPQPTLGEFLVTQNSAIFHTGGGEAAPKAGIVPVKAIDNDGDAVPFNLSFSFTDDSPSVTVSTQIPVPAVVLDESAVDTDPAPDGDNDPAGRKTVTVDFSGNFNAAFGADGAADTGGKVYALQLSGPNVPSGMFALTADGIGQGTQIVLNQSGNTITGSADGQDYFTITVNPATGQVTFEQSINVWHSNPANDDDTSFLHTAAADALKLTLTIKDGDNDTDSVSINLGHDVFQIEDDGPRANDDPVELDPQTTGTADVVFIVDVSGSMTNGGGSIVVPNVPDFSDNRLGLARFAMRELLNSHPEILNVQFIKFDDNLSSPSSVWLTRADALLYINNDANFVGGGATNYDVALQEAINIYDASPRPAGVADQTLVYFLSDGAPNTANDPGGDAGITNNGTGNDVSIAEWETFVGDPLNNITNVFAIGLGSANVGNLEPIAYPNTDTSPADGDEDRVVIIPDSNITELTQTLDDLLGSVLPPAVGNVLTNDNAGTDGYAEPELVSVTYNAVTYTFDPATQFIIDLGVGRGSLLINDDGTYTYTPPAGSVDGTPFFVEYTIRDRDGDTSTAKLLIDLNGSPLTDLNGVAGGDDVVIGFSEQISALIAPAATIADDDANLASMTVTLTNRPNGNAVESLSLNGPAAAAAAGLTVTYVAATGVLTITGSASVAAYQTILNGILYNNTSDTPDTTPRSVTVVVNDGTSDSIANTVTINVTPLNDEPAANITPASYNATEQTNLNLHGTGLSISDVDAGSGIVSITLSVGFGILTLGAGNSGATIGVGNGTSSVTVTGTVTQINNLLGGIDTGPGSAGTIVYNANDDAPPADTTLTLTVNDNGNTGGGNQSDFDTATINIAPAAEAPVAGTDRIYTNISSLITVQDSLLLKNDTDADTAHASLVVVSADAGGNGSYFDTDPSHAGTSVTFELDIDGGTSFSNGTTKSFDYVVGDPTLPGDGTVNVTYDTAGSINGSSEDDILIGLNVGLNGGAGDDHMIGTGTTDLLDYSNVSSNWNLTLGAGGSGNANIDGADTYEGIDGIIGGTGNNVLTGNDSNNILNGGGGTDTFNLAGGGDGGDDTIVYTSLATLNGADIVNGFDNVSTDGHDTISLDALFDSMGVAAANRAGRLQLVDTGADVELRLNADTSNANFEVTILSFKSIADTTFFTIGNGDDDINVGS